MKKMSSILLAMAVSVGLTGAAVAGAKLSAVQGSIMVNNGAGFQAVDGISTLKAGDRVLVNAKSSGQLVFPDGCSVKLRPGLITIGATSPCKVKAQGDGGSLVGPLVGLATVAGIGGVLYAVEESNKKTSP